MGYSSEGSIGSWGAKYRAYIGASTSNNTDSTCDVYLTGGGQLYMVDGWNNSSMSFSGKSNLSGNCAGGSGSASWSNSDWYYSSFKVATITKTHASQTLTYYCTFNFGGAGAVTASASVTIGAKTSYTITYNANGGSGAPASATKWYGENLTLSSTVPTRTNHQFLGWSTSSTATSATYSAGGTYTANAGAVLYAVWKDVTPATITAQSVTIASATKLNFSLTADVTCNLWQYSLDSGTWTTYSSTSGTSASGSVTVTSGTHTLQLRCRRASNSVYTTGTKFTRDTVPPTVSFTVSDITTESFKINATSSVASDRWWYSINNGSTWTQFSTASGTSASYTITDLTVNTTYQVKVRARKTSNQMTGDSSTQTVKTQGGIVHVKVNGSWKEAIAYVKIGSAWKQVICYTKVGSSWRINT